MRGRKRGGGVVSNEVNQSDAGERGGGVCIVNQPWLSVENMSGETG